MTHRNNKGDHELRKKSISVDFVKGKKLENGPIERAKTKQKKIKIQIKWAMYKIKL